MGKEHAITDFPKTPHLTNGEIARIVDGTRATADDSRLWEHLRSCPQCFEVFQESAVNRGIYLFDDKKFRASDELIALGREISDVSVISKPGQHRRTASTWGWFQGRLPRRGLVGAIATVVILATIWVGVSRRGEPRELDQRLTSPIVSALIAYSSTSPFVLPGGEQAPYQTGPVFRSGVAPSEIDFESSIDELYDAYIEGDETAAVGYWLAVGLLVDLQFELARQLSEAFHDKYPGDLRISTLCAVVKCMDGDLETAESILREIVRSVPDDFGAMTNLAIVLRERGKTMEATGLLVKVRDDDSGTPLAGRAEKLLAAE